MSEAKLCTSSKGWFHRFRHRFTLKNTRITGEAASVDEAAATTFVADFEGVVMVWWCYLRF